MTAATSTDESVEQSRIGQPKPTELWRESREFDELFRAGWGTNAAWRLRVGWILLIIVAILVPVVIHLEHDSGWRIAILLFQVLLTLVGLTFFVEVGFRYGAARRAFYERVRLEKARRVDEAVEKLREKLSIPNLFVLNRRQLDEYHVMSVRQQHVSFRNAQIASVVGL